MAEYEKYEYFIKELEEYYLQDKRRSVITRSLLKQAIEYIKELLADATTVRHGRWLESENGPMQKCSVCGATGWDGFYYCPNCGARMDGDRE